MSKAQHTSGPWELVQSNGWPFRIRIESENTVVISQDRCAYSTKDCNIGDVINAVNFRIGKERDNAAHANQVQLANARLIAAAPELLEALEVVIRGVPDTWGGVKNARAAIAKAKGE